MKKKFPFNAVKVLQNLLTQLLQNEFTNEWRNVKSALKKKKVFLPNELRKTRNADLINRVKIFSGGFFCFFLRSSLHAHAAHGEFGRWELPGGH